MLDRTRSLRRRDSRQRHSPREFVAHATRLGRESVTTGDVLLVGWESLDGFVPSEAILLQQDVMKVVGLLQAEGQLVDEGGDGEQLSLG